MLACAVALVLLMDASGSISDAEWALQRDGTAEAARATLELLGVGTLPGDDPARWLRAHAVTSGGFALSAEGWAGFARAMRRKLAMELASAAP